MTQQLGPVVALQLQPGEKTQVTQETRAQHEAAELSVGILGFQMTRGQSSVPLREQQTVKC